VGRWEGGREGGKEERKKERGGKEGGRVVLVRPNMILYCCKVQFWLTRGKRDGDESNCCQEQAADSVESHAKPADSNKIKIPPLMCD